MCPHKILKISYHRKDHIITLDNNRIDLLVFLLIFSPLLLPQPQSQLIILHVKCEIFSHTEWWCWWWCNIFCFLIWWDMIPSHQTKVNFIMLETHPVLDIFLLLFVHCEMNRKYSSIHWGTLRIDTCVCSNEYEYVLCSGFKASRITWKIWYLLSDVNDFKT